MELGRVAEAESALAVFEREAAAAGDAQAAVMATARHGMLPPGPLLAVMMDLHQGWVADMGLPGPDAGNGGRHLFLPPGWDGQVPDGHFVARSSTSRMIGGVRAIPLGGDLPAANDRIRAVQVRPLDPPAARIGNGQLRVQSFADRRPERVVWPGAQWQWAALRENAGFTADGYLDVDAREKWFFQAIGVSPAMMRRTVGAGSL